MGGAEEREALVPQVEEARWHNRQLEKQAQEAQQAQRAAAQVSPSTSMCKLDFQTYRLCSVLQFYTAPMFSPVFLQAKSGSNLLFCPWRASARSLLQPHRCMSANLMQVHTLLAGQPAAAGPGGAAERGAGAAGGQRAGRQPAPGRAERGPEGGDDGPGGQPGGGPGGCRAAAGTPPAPPSRPGSTRRCAPRGPHAAQQQPCCAPVPRHCMM